MKLILLFIALVLALPLAACGDDEAAPTTDTTTTTTEPPTTTTTTTTAPPPPPGPTVVRVRATKPAEGLIAFAQREGVTHVIFGQTARSRWELLWRGSTLDRFLEAVPDATVQVVPQGR